MTAAQTDKASNRTALITGASSGIGAATARRMAGLGWRVVLVARRTDRLEALVGEIRAAGGQAECLTADLASPEGRRGLCEQVSARFGTPDLLVNNAGQGWYGYFVEMAPGLPAEMVSLNVLAAVELTRWFLPAMLRRGSGQIIQISSIVGNMPEQGVAIYGGSKAFLDAFTTSLHRELKGSGVQVGMVKPGPVKTEFFAAALHQPNGRVVPGERFAVTPEQVARAVTALVNRPRRVVFVPGLYGVTVWLEVLFAWLIDLLGPLLLKQK